jgi:HAD superfamily hydrolase (TIGR01509 family)
MQFFRRLRPVQALSFDLDDTLYDNVPVMIRAEQTLYDFLRTEYPQTAHWSIRDWAQRRSHLMLHDNRLASDMTALRLATIEQGLQAAGLTAAAVKQGAEAGLAVFLQARNQVTISPQVHQLLTQLGQHYPLLALSNGNVNVASIGLADYFSMILQPAPQRRGKPHPDMFLEAQQHLPQRQPWQFLHIGDSATADVLGAQRAGWQSAWFSGGLGHPEQFKVLPTLRFDDLNELRDLLL